METDVIEALKLSHFYEKFYFRMHLRQFFRHFMLCKQYTFLYINMYFSKQPHSVFKKIITTYNAVFIVN
jgi:hypothetical protein